MATSIPVIGVTGSTGELGGRVATRLAALGYSQRLLVRNLARAPHLPGAELVQASYEDGPSMRAALSGIQTLFLVSGYGPTRLEQHFSAIDAAIAVGIERIVYTSFLSTAPLATFTHAREHYLTEQPPAVTHSCVRLSTLIELLVGSPMRGSCRDLLATAPSPGSLVMTWPTWLSPS